MNNSSLTLKEIEDTAALLSAHVVKTPFIWSSADLSQYGVQASALGLKLELFQKTGTFKLRGVLATLMKNQDQTLHHGIVTASGGNHGVAVAWGAQSQNIHAKIVMPHFASDRRKELCRKYGAEVVLVSDLTEVFSVADEIQRSEQRFMIHPFEGRNISLGTATIGREVCEDSSGTLDVLLVPVGGGGLLSGIASACALYSPHTEVIGIEPYGADAMFQSFQANACSKLSKIKTIADSLGSPLTLPFSFNLCKHHASEIVRVSDDEIRNAMKIAFEEFKLALEPASAATLAALLGPLRECTSGKRVGLIICGANIDLHQFKTLTG